MKCKRNFNVRNRFCAILASTLFVLGGTQIFAQNALNWVKPQYNRIPRNAVKGGDDTNGAVLYVCRTIHNGTTLPGKVVENKCNYNWGTTEYTSSNYEILTGDDYYWSGYDIDYDAAIIGGQSRNEDYYICRAILKDGSKQPGRLQNNKCNYGYAGKGYTSTSFEVLQSESAQNSAYSLLDAALNGNAQTVRDALHSGQAVNQKNTTGQTALMLGASKGSVDVVRILLYEGATVDMRDNDGNTALIYAAWKGFPQVVGFVITRRCKSQRA